MPTFFLKGLAMGAIIAMPFGAVGMLCLGRAITHGLRIGLLSGIGAAAADAFYGAVAAFGLTFVSDFLAEHATVMRIGGGLFLVGMGLRLALSKTAPKPLEAPKRRYAGAFVSVFLLTLTNPMTMVGFLAIFAGFGLGQAEAHAAEAASVVAGVFCGSMVWWVAIAFGGKLLRFRLLAHMRAIKRVSGWLIAAFGLWAVFFAR
ncbi:Lysine exporter protein (LYSE/YGGA) [Solidesulfovibrio carbinoliphilus subsp. oakridgensis]|uniref:Lysine exporter protein (LYSE/YGGA) n=1 Tax=Solidesulfovibrio carbinoliphilus subsp. oakridgensis TaxID=694327 RepID=G7QCS0_9BACT|nr:LysE family transporter [Solidesulfovibrio carbinoliphilus]EHJ46226.1 Lysine exporter protein (LYSE/YGGA) [Solidesulfovibrio carbinoliphilus subsp. oakridgensis]